MANRTNNYHEYLCYQQAWNGNRIKYGFTILMRPSQTLFNWVKLNNFVDTFIGRFEEKQAELQHNE